MFFGHSMKDDSKHCGPRWGFARRGAGGPIMGGPPWARFSAGGLGEQGGPRVRMFAQGDLRLLLLALISDQPSHGYDLIRTIEARFGGSYSPSPGTIYPSLTYLEEQGFISARPEEGGKKSYEATAAGRAFLEDNAAQVENLMARIDVMARRSGHAPAPESVLQAVHTLRHAVMSRFGFWNKEEEARVRGLLEAVARDIADGPNSKPEK